MSAWAMHEISKTFGRTWPGSTLHRALDQVDLLVHPGERVGLIGESGAGKTTLARVGLGLVGADSGRVEILGEDTARWSASRWRLARRHVQLLFQDPRAMLNAHMPLGRLLREGARLHRPDHDPRHEALRVLDAVGLGGRQEAYPTELSGGELRRAGIARLLLSRPRLVVADEPTAGLDAALKASLVELLLESVGPECAVVLVSHDLPLVTWATQRLVVMRSGQVVDRFSTDQLFSPERHPYSRELLDAAGLRPPRSEVTP